MALTSSRYAFLSPLSPGKLAREALRERKMPIKPELIQENYSFWCEVVVKFNASGLFESTTSNAPKNLALILEPPVTKIDLKSAMLQARIIHLPRLWGQESKRAMEILRTENPYSTLGSMIGWPKEKKDIFPFLTKIDKQKDLDYIDKGLGNGIFSVLNELGIEDSSGLSRLLNTWVIKLTLEIVAQNVETVATFSLDEVIVRSDEVEIPENIFVRKDRVA
jgi:hypothetical protein